MPELLLLRHDEELTVGLDRAWIGYGPGEPVSGHPQIPTTALDRLRTRCLDRWSDAGDPPRWYAGDASPWAAVLDLHRVGEHDTAHVLAVLLRWCDQQDAAGTVIWTIQTASAAPG